MLTLEHSLLIKEYHITHCKRKLESGVNEGVKGKGIIENIIEEIEIGGGNGRGTERGREENGGGAGVMGERV